jgi:hypothetical protein
MQFLRTIEANDDTCWGCLACAEVDVVVWNLFGICNGASLWLLGVAAARRGDTRGFFSSEVRPTYVRIITIRNGRLKFELLIITFI